MTLKHLEVVEGILNEVLLILPRLTDITYRRRSFTSVIPDTTTCSEMILFFTSQSLHISVFGKSSTTLIHWVLFSSVLRI